MSLVFFEGFETLGSTIGYTDAANVKSRFEKRMVTNAGTGSNSVYLTDNHDSTGYCLDLGGYFNTHIQTNSIQLSDYTVLQNWTSPLAPIITVGFRLHIPNPACNAFTIGSFYDSGGNELFGLTVENSCQDLYIRGSGGSWRYTASSVFATLDTWYHIEFSVRFSGMSGNFGVAEVATTPADTSTTLTITNQRWFRDPWDETTSYGSGGGDEVRWKGRAYTSNAIAGNTNKRPDEEPSYWTDDGLEYTVANTSDTSGTQPQFQMEAELADDTYNPRYSYSSNITTVIASFAGSAWNWSLHKPMPGDMVFFGCNDFIKLKVDGSEVFHSQRPLSLYNTGKQLDYMRFKNPSFPTPAGSGEFGTGANFIGIDDIFIAERSSLLSDYFNESIPYDGDEFGVCTIEPLPPNIDVTKEWSPSTGTTHYTLVDENGADSSDYLDAASNGLEDRFGHADSDTLSVDKGYIYGVRIEAEAINTTSGSPTIEVSMGDAGQISEVFTVDNTGDYAVFQFDSETNPGGDLWTFEDLDDLESGIESAGF